MGHPFLQLLELPTSATACSIFLSSTMKDYISKTGNIHGVVSPDLPPTSFLLTLLSNGWKIGAKPPNSNSKASPMPEMATPERISVQASCLQIRTVAAQLRQIGDIRKRLIKCAQEIDYSGCKGSLLLVSGGHPLRKYPFYKRFLPGDSFAMLKMASKLRQAGEIPSGVQLWAVENPLANTVDRLEQKILAGAETVILQPPLLQERFGNWWDLAQSRGLMDQIPILVGVPLVTSAANLEFWFGLTQSSGEEVDLELGRLRKMEATLSKNAIPDFYRMETLQRIKFAKSLPGVSGVHIMPATPSGWRQLDKLKEQIFWFQC